MEQKCLIWLFVDWNFKKTFVIFEINDLEFVYFKNFVKKWKCLNLGPKIWNLKKLLSHLKSSPLNLSNCKISQKKKKRLNLGLKMPYFILGYFWARILKIYCHIWNQHPRTCLIAKFREKMKMPKFGTKNALFGYLWDRILKNFVIFKISTQNLSNTCQAWVFDS